MATRTGDSMKNGELDIAVDAVATIDQGGSETTQTLALIERLIKDPAVDVDKLERMLAMHERVLARQAEAAFNSDFAAMQTELPELAERGQIVVKGRVQSTYAKFADIMETIKPILAERGFALSFRTSFDAGECTVSAVLLHREGHQVSTSFTAKADSSGNKNQIQGSGSAQSYGMRYTTRALLNLTTRGLDTDGQGTAAAEAPGPDGYDNWLADMEAVADSGTSALMEAWTGSRADYRRHLTATNPQQWAQVKARAARVS